MNEALELVIILLDRLGGRVTLTQEELATVDARRKIVVHTSLGLQDDTVTIEVFPSGS